MASHQNPPLRFLMAASHYSPSSTSGSNLMGKIIADGIAAAGHEVVVYTKSPGPNDDPDGALTGVTIEGDVTVRRVKTLPTENRWSRLLGGVVFALKLIVHCATPRRQYDVISVMTVPPVLMGLAGAIAARLCGARLIYQCMDLHPEAAGVVGDIRPGSAGFRLLQTLDNITLRAAGAAIVMSTDMENTLRRRGHDKPNIVVINNLDPVADDPLPALEPAIASAPGTFRLIFAGNMGEFQGLGDIIDAFEVVQATTPSVELVFVGSGSSRATLEQRAASNQAISFQPQVAPDVAKALVADADAAIISLAPGVISAAYPSKTMVYLDTGTPILAVIEPDSQLAQLILELGAGVVAPPGSVSEIADAMQSLVSGTAAISDRDTIVAGGRANFGHDVILSKWVDLVEKLAADEPVAPPRGNFP